MKDHVSICVCTYRRNPMVERLLRGLRGLETDGRFDFSAVVVDNDAAGPARETVARMRSELAMAIEYDIEPERTIPAARNRALKLARGNYIAIIDDDEIPPAHWLLTLYRSIQTFDVDGALGPVHPFFEKKPPAWLIKGRFCDRPVHRTGTLLEWGQTRTGNVLLKKSVFEDHGLSFDLRWKTSGSDRAFFKQAMRAGCRFIAVEEAPVYEVVPPERWTKRYYVRRALVHGYNAHQNSLSERRGISRLVPPLKSGLAVLVYALALPPSALLGDHLMMKCLERGSHHLSRLLAGLGIELIKTRDF
jgi:succinoglycan biosynthesis protein ExoM